MKKLLFLTVIAMFISFSMFAQDGGVKFSVGAELGFATGGFSNTHSIGIGATGQVELPLQENLKGTATGGILFYNGKSISGISGAKATGQTIIPLRVGVKYFLTPGVYGALQAGVGFFSNYATGSAFAYSPQVGYEFESKTGKSVDVALKYDGYSKSGGSLGSFGIRLALVL